jgi:hypothetical protein
MSARRPIAILSSLLFAGTACARLFSASTHDDQPRRITRPPVEKATQRRREGSDVTVPNESKPNWPVRILAPCDSTAPKAQGARDCQRVDDKVDSLRAPIAPATKSRP